MLLSLPPLDSAQNPSPCETPPTFVVGFPSVKSLWKHSSPLQTCLELYILGDSESSQVDNEDKLPQEDTSETQSV